VASNRKNTADANYFVESTVLMCFRVCMVTDTINRIRRFVKTPGVTAKGLAAKAGLHQNTLVGLHDPDWNPSAKTLKAIEEHLPNELDNMIVLNGKTIRFAPLDGELQDGQQ
jgi:predicted transcriptional regulator